MGRWAHAWGWTALWLLVLGRSTQAFPVGAAGAALLGLALVPGVYLPLVLMRRERSPDLSGSLSAPLTVLLGGVFVSFLVLGGASLFGYWDQRPRGATMHGVAAAVVGLHVLGALCIGAAEHWLWPRDQDD